MFTQYFNEIAPRHIVALTGVLLCVIPSSLWALSHGESLQGWVSLNGHVSVSRGATTTSELNCDSNPELAFTFSETASPGLLTLNLDGPTDGQIALEIAITGSCGDGTASFSYFHDSEIGLPGFGPGINVSPAATQVTLPLQVGASQVLLVNYQMEGDRALSSRWRLIGDQITFVIDQTLGQASARRPLAQVNFRGNVVIPDDFTGRQLRRLRDAGFALNRACRRASEGSRLDQICRAIEEGASSVELQQRAALAFDTNAVSAIATNAEQSGQIQNRNVTQRIAERRGGSRGFSASGLSLSYAGQRFDQRFLPLSLQSNDTSGSTLLGERWGAFINGDITIGERDDREKEPGLDFESWGITAGLDYRFDSGSIMGIALGYGESQSDLDTDGGEVDSQNWSLQLFGSIDLIDNLYIDATVGTVQGDFEQNRVVDLTGIGSLTREIASGATDTQEWSASLALNYRLMMDSGWIVTPFASFLYTDIDIDGFSEGGSAFDFEYPGQSFESERWSLGVRASRAINLERGVLLPFVNLSWQHEAGLDGYSVQPSLTGSTILGPTVEVNDPDRDTGRAEVGFSFVMASGNQFFINYSGLLFDRDGTEHAVFLGARREF